MASTVPVTQQYQHALQLSTEMLNSAQQEKWDDLIKLSSSYIMTLQTALGKEQENISREEEKEICSSLTHLIENEDEIRALLKGRLDILSCEISSMRQSQQGSNAYSAQLFSPYR